MHSFIRNVVFAAAVLSVTTSRVAAAQASERELCNAIVDRSTNTDDVRARSKAMIAANAGKPIAAFLNGCVAYADGKTDKAADFFEAAANAEAKSIYFDWLGRSYGDQAGKASKLKQPFLARKVKHAFERAVELDADNLDARFGLLQFYQLAPSVMGGSEAKARQQVAEIRGRNAYRGGFAAAQYASRAKDLATVQREYEALTRSHPDSIAPWNGLLQLHANAARWSEAFKAADAIRAIPTRAHLGDYAVGRVAALSGEQLDRGEAALRRYLATTPAANEPPLASAHYRLAQVLAHRKETAAARAEYQEVLRLQPDHQDAKKGLAALK